MVIITAISTDGTNKKASEKIKIKYSIRTKTVSREEIFNEKNNEKFYLYVFMCDNGSIYYTDTRKSYWRNY